MGCDIHSMLEIKQGEYEEGPDGEETYAIRWVRNTAGIFRYPYFDESRPVSVMNTPYSPDPLRSRNYRLFAILADVRNGRGFAGVDTGDQVEPIAEPRGVPEDATPEWLDEVAQWDVDMHSQSWFTLAELEAYDWDGLVFERGYVTEEEYLQVRGTNAPPPGSYSGGISGAGVRSLTALEYESLSPAALESLHDQFPVTDRGWSGLFIQHQWARTKRDAMGELAEAMEVMRNSAPRLWDPEAQTHSEPDHTAIRIVFGFDN